MDSPTASRLKALRKRHGLTQEELAQVLHISRDYLSQLENGREPGPVFLRLLEILESTGLVAQAAGRKSQQTESTSVREAGAPYGAPASRETCEAYFSARLDEAGQTGNPNAFPYVYGELLKHFPPGFVDHLVNLPDVDLGLEDEARAEGETGGPRHRSAG